MKPAWEEAPQFLVSCRPLGVTRTLGLTLLEPFGSLWNADKHAMFGHFWSKMDHFWAIPSHKEYHM